MSLLFRPFFLAFLFVSHWCNGSFFHYIHFSPCSHIYPASFISYVRVRRLAYIYTTKSWTFLFSSSVVPVLHFRWDRLGVGTSLGLGREGRGWGSVV
ncbi:hypothetical protein HOY80DRAFT_986041 [Tuber brumale]|nr:hypothetical protein HOY80DRAFT_986041 [Tuber brumale]